MTTFIIIGIISAYILIGAYSSGWYVASTGNWRTGDFPLVAGVVGALWIAAVPVILTYRSAVTRF